MLPKSIQIQTIDYCNRNCIWCGNHNRQKDKSKIITDEIYDKILHDLKVVDYKGAIHPYLNAEPLADPMIVSRVRKARKMFPDNVIFLSTNGDYLNEPITELLIDAGLTWMGISVYDFKNKLLPLLYKYRKYLVFTSLGELRMTFFNFAGHSKVSCISPKNSCDWVDEKAYINYRGEVVLCCSDFDYETSFGNVLNDSFYNIYNSPAYNEYRDYHKTERGGELPLCETCNRINTRVYA